MPTNRGFRIAGGSIMGADHIGRGQLLKGRNNQDAYEWIQLGPEKLVAVVCDGCGGSPKVEEKAFFDFKHSEVGAKIGTRLILSHLVPRLERIETAAADEEERVLGVVLENVRQATLSSIQSIAGAMTHERGNINQTIRDYFLFTTVGLIILPNVTAVFSIGDGLYAVNGNIQRLGPFPDNTPPYLSYGLLRTVDFEKKPELLRFQVHRCMPTRFVRSAAIGSDGAGDLADAAEKLIPGQAEVLGPLSQFWEDKRYLKNPMNISRRLTLCNSEVSRLEGGTIRFDPRLLPDDTTLVVAVWQDEEARQEEKGGPRDNGLFP